MSSAEGQLPAILMEHLPSRNAPQAATRRGQKRPAEQELPDVVVVDDAIPPGTSGQQVAAAATAATTTTTTCSARGSDNPARPSARSEASSIPVSAESSTAVDKKKKEADTTRTKETQLEAVAQRLVVVHCVLKRPQVRRYCAAAYPCGFAIACHGHWAVASLRTKVHACLNHDDSTAQFAASTTRLLHEFKAGDLQRPAPQQTQLQRQLETQQLNALLASAWGLVTEAAGILSLIDEGRAESLRALLEGIQRAGGSVTGRTWRSGTPNSHEDSVARCDARSEIDSSR